MNASKLPVIIRRKPLGNPQARHDLPRPMYEKSKSVASAIKYFEIRDTYGYSFVRFALKNELLVLSMVLFKNTVSKRETDSAFCENGSVL
jgi:hypothetical protein